MAGNGKGLMGAGLVLAFLYILMAPRAPLGPWLSSLAGHVADVVEGLVGVSSIVLVLAGYARYLYSKYPRWYARYHIFRLAVLLAWIITAALIWEALFSGRGLWNYMGSLLLASPLAVALGFIVERRSRPPRRTAMVIVSYRRGEKERGD